MTAGSCCATAAGAGRPLLADGTVLDVTNVIWCTGFRHDLSWIDLPIFGEDGELVHERGVVERARFVSRLSERCAGCAGFEGFEGATA